MILQAITALMPWRRLFMPALGVGVVLVVIIQSWRLDHWQGRFQNLQTEYKNLEQNWQASQVARQREQGRFRQEMAHLEQRLAADRIAHQAYQKMRENLNHDPQNPADAGLVAVRERVRTQLQEPAIP